MNRTWWLCCALATSHLLLVAAGAAGLLRLPGGPAGATVRWWGAMTGADAGFNFFAPRVGAESRARFTLADADGREWEADLDAGRNREARLRVGSVTGLFLTGPEEEAFRQDLAASWAAAVFGRHPDATLATFQFEVYEIPPMACYRAGDRPRWQELYAGTFTLAPDGRP